MKIGIVDYGLGNLHSVRNAFNKIEKPVEIIETPDDAEGISHLVLPGVGAFADGMRGVRSRGWDEYVVSFAKRGNPILGICLGAQLLCSQSEEFGTHLGLGLINGFVRPIPVVEFKVPHVGWGKLIQKRSWNKTALEKTSNQAWMYFVHSFHAECADENLLATVEHGGIPLTAALSHGNVLGCQFHPEKSGEVGLGILNAFCNL